MFHNKIQTMLFKSKEPTLVNIKHNKEYDVYIGRPSIWGNPYTHHNDSVYAKYKVDSVEEAVEKYREYLLNSPELLEKLHELEGKVLGCWCMPKKPITGKYYCHGQILIEEFRNHCMNIK